jgi:PEP-CTERM motif
MENIMSNSRKNVVAMNRRGRMLRHLSPQKENHTMNAIRTTLTLLSVLALVGLASPAWAAPTISFSAPFTDDASTGISAGNTYTHAISGGEAVAVNGVNFSLLNSATTPANFNWNTNGFSKDQVTNNNNGWSPATGGVTGAGVIGLLNDFTYSGSGANPGSHQTYTLSGLTPGATYDARLYVRQWDNGGSGRPIDLTFTNGGSSSQTVIEDRASLQGYANDDVAYYVNARFTATGTMFDIDAAVPAAAPANSGSFHLYGLTNQLVSNNNRTMIMDLFNTGVDASGTPLGDNVDDPHYALTVDPSGLGDATVIADGFPIGPWVANDSVSRWIGPADGGDANGPGGDYTYQTTFTLSPEADVASVIIGGLWGTDNSGEIFVNGQSTGQTVAGFSALAPFELNGSNSTFHQGVNTLEFVVDNASSGPTGLRVEGIKGSFGPVPEPATAALGLMALSALGMGLRRRR